jgi:hypothetical protein
VSADGIASYDYCEFTGQPPNDAAPAPLVLIPMEERATPTELKER